MIISDLILDSFLNFKLFHLRRAGLYSVRRDPSGRRKRVVRLLTVNRLCHEVWLSHQVHGRHYPLLLVLFFHQPFLFPLPNDLLQLTHGQLSFHSQICELFLDHLSQVLVQRNHRLVLHQSEEVVLEPLKQRQHEFVTFLQVVDKVPFVVNFLQVGRILQKQLLSRLFTNRP